MPYEFKRAPPWGRSLREYNDMFRLSDFPKNRNILGCADGPSSFNYEANIYGHNVLSLDPIYEEKARTIKEAVMQYADPITDMVRKNRNEYNWDYIFDDPEHLKKCRIHAMNLFLEDYQKHPDRYMFGKLPTLPLQTKAFDLALVSNFLFLYDNCLDFKFHLQSIIELLRIASEVRIFPITSAKGGISLYIPPVMEALKKAGYSTETFDSEYRFIKESSKTLIVRQNS